jgi:adenylate kinase family enzyme
MRIAILGNSGSGKSTLARWLSEAHALPVLDLDTVAWQAGRIAVARDAACAREDVRLFTERNDAWIVEGCYAGLIERALLAAPLLVYADPGVAACVANCRARPWEPHKYESKEAQDEQLAFLLEWVGGYDTRPGELGRVEHERVFDSYAGPKRRLAHAIADTRDAAAWLGALRVEAALREPRRIDDPASGWHGAD